MTNPKMRFYHVPASFDWRNNNGKNYVQAIKDQEQCGSCWTFASIF